MYSNFAIFRHLHTLSSSRNDVLISAHSLLITALSSAAVRAALICLIKSLSRIGVGIRTKKEEKPPKNSYDTKQTKMDKY